MHLDFSMLQCTRSYFYNNNYNVNNHILDDVHYIYGGQSVAFLGGEFVSVLSKDLLNFEPPIENPDYTPVTTIS